MAAKKSMKIEKYATKALMAKHENSEGKKMAAMEKKMGEKNIVSPKKKKKAQNQSNKY
jgi:hypothetical protein